MASANSTPTADPFPSSDDIAAKAVNKRYEGLVTVRTKAIKGKGAWYWAHLEPILIRNPSTNHPKAVKLKCSLCDSVFSASNPSRTATEHLKRGTCPNISSVLRPNSSVSPLPLSSLPSPSSHNHRKRSSQLRISPPTPHAPPTTLEVHSLAMVESTRYCGEFGYLSAHNAGGGASNTGLYNHHLMLSGGKDDLGALAMLENSVKKLKSPKASPGPILSKEQIESAVELLAEWFYESCGSVSLSSLEHPKFRAFLNHVGLPALSRREFSGARLDAKFDEAKAESEARIEDAMFFQVASSGWKSKNLCGFPCGEENLVKFTVNLPNRTSVFQKAVFTGGPVSSKYAEEILWDTVTEICGESVQRCVGIVADKYKAKALKNLEVQNHWMVNLSCQLQGFVSLIKDFNKEFPLFRVVTENCLKLANFVNTESQVRNIFQKYKTQELDCAGLLRVPSPKCDTSKSFRPVFAMLEDVLSCSRVLQMVVLDDSCKVIFVEDPSGREVGRMIQSEAFWNELESVYSLVKMIRGMAQEMEAERPLVGQCLPLWEQLKAKMKEWCAKCSIAEAPVEKIIENRFRKMYHPAWAAAFILDPLNLMRDTSGKYLPPFKCLTHEQEKDVDKLITRLVSREEAHIALMELMKWRSEGLDPLYAQAVQVKQRDPVTGKMKVANPQSSRLVWETCLSEFKSLGKVAVRLIFLQATSCGFKCNWSFMKWVCVHRHSRIGIEKAQKMIFVAAHAKLERRDLSNEEEKDAELFAGGGVEEDMLNEVFSDAPSV
ncbi:Ribonuclease H-like domain containing protein [Parasponia andersonii]|uniref:Ribonuclease H-like domain containing protein n=1 Tax=Parasponia andersonii TaxID=3476 RepID=A0A2P5C5E7_PARAD|nr:Ribonuclease H-like domain containing protein [Parasponia andersonii]